MSIERNKQIARQFIESLTDLSGASCMALMSDTGEFRWMIRSSSLPLPSKLSRQEFGDFMQRMSSVFPNGVRHEVLELIAEDDVVAVETECFAEMPDGRPYNNLFHFRLTIRAGKVECVKEYTDFLYAKEVVFGG